MVDENYKRHRGRAIATDGRKTRVALQTPFHYHGQFKAIYTLGIRDPDLGESTRTDFLLGLLRGDKSIDDPRYGLLQKFFFPEPRHHHTPSSVPSSIDHPLTILPARVNESQKAVVEAIVCSSEPFLVVQGPPGTGKTSSISVATQNIISQRSFVYIIAHSNMGVRTVADRLLKDKVRFKLIVSADFYEGWWVSSSSILPGNSL